jgi:hypothetical protein
MENFISVELIACTIHTYFLEHRNDWWCHIFYLLLFLEKEILWYVQNCKQRIYCSVIIYIPGTYKSSCLGKAQCKGLWNELNPFIY